MINLRNILLKNERALIILFAAAAAAFGFYVNRGIVIKGLYMDDLYMWSCYGEQSIWEFAFPIGTSTRFRPVYWLATYAQMFIIGTHPERFVTFNIIINILVSWELMYMALRLSGKGPAGAFLSFLVSICYLASRFAYYQIGQALGLMETMALSLSIAVLYLLLSFAGPARPEGRGTPRPEGGGPGRGCFFYAALFLWFLLVFVHERYLALFPMFYASLAACAFLSRGGERREPHVGIFKIILPAALLFLIMGIRVYATGSAMPAGTGGTSVSDTFSLREAVSYCFAEVLYILGVNAGPEYLCGLEWGDTPGYIKLMVKAGALCMALVLLIFAAVFTGALLKEAAKSKKTAGGHSPDERPGASGYGEDKATAAADIFFASLLFILFMALCIACSSVTIRLEMRWIYVSYAAALLFGSYMFGVISLFSGRAGGIFKAAGVLSLAAAAAYAVISIYTNIFFRGYFHRLYFWSDQLRMNSLAEETIEKYGAEGIFGKNIYILENTYGMSDFYAATFFKVYDPEKKAEGTCVIFIGGTEEVPQDELSGGSCIVLEEIPEENAYRDITGELRQGVNSD